MEQTGRHDDGDVGVDESRRKHAGEDSDTAIATKAELKAWYMYDFANSTFDQLVNNYYPVLLQDLAQDAAGFPDVCPNYVPSNHTISQELFGVDSEMYIENDQAPCSSCKVWAGDSNTYCEGKPTSVMLCYESDGITVRRLTNQFLGYDLDPTEFVLYLYAFSVVFQALAFISLSALGDYSGLRKRYFVICSVLGSASCFLCATTPADTWWLGGIWMIAVHVLYGIGYLLYNAWIPLLAEAHGDVVALPEGPERRELVNAVMDQISSTGFMYGFAGGILSLVVTAPFLIFLDFRLGLRMAIGTAGVWWFCCQLYTFKHLKPRPGPPLPAGTSSYVGFSWSRFLLICKRARHLPQTLKFLFLWFCFSDGIATINNTAVLALAVMFRYCYVSKSVVLLGTIMGTPLFCIIGLWLTNHYRPASMSTRGVVVIGLVVFSMIPVYGMVGFATDNFGMHFGIELLFVSAVYGLAYGVIASYSRSLFGQLIPPGYETQFFGLFEITDKGSSWMGPIVVATVYKRTGNLRYAFMYCLFMIAVPTVFLSQMDIERGIREARMYAEMNPISGVAVADDANNAATAKAATNSRLRVFASI